MEKLILFVGVCVGILSAQIASAESPIWGTYKVECPANSDTYIGITTTRAPVFTGKVQSVQSGTTNIVAQGEPNWSANQFVYVAGSQTNHYYLKFTSGELEGAWYDIKSNGAYFAEIEIGSAELAKVKADDTFQIIPHWTLATLFPNGGGFTKATKLSPTAGATILRKYTKYTDEGIQYTIGTNKLPSVGFFYRSFGTKQTWMDTDLNEVNDAVIEPNAVIKVVSSTNKDIATYNGVISKCATSFEIFTSIKDNVVQSQDIYVATPSAVDIELKELTDALIGTTENPGPFEASKKLVPSAVDTILVYDSKEGVKDALPAKKFFYRNFNTTKKWLDSDLSDADEVTLKSSTAIVIRKKAGADTTYSRVTFRPSYLEYINK